ncbi:MAG: hypothetical protein KBG15_13575 [Kofleriaceae bacterium]|nr:hypothetical protein [Kofleriaceae bacterium]
MARTCAGCKRPLGATAARCIYCGVAAPQVESGDNDGAGGLGRLGAGPFLLVCGNGCGRKNQVSRDRLERLLERDALNCSYCAQRMVLPPEVAEFVAALKAPFSRRPVMVICPGCGRNAPTDPGVQSRCMYCSIEYLSPNSAEGVAAMGPLHGLVAASPRDVTAALQGLPAEAHCQLAAELLRARAARNEVAVGEAEAIATALVRLADWQPAMATIIELPLSNRDAEVLVPRVLFGVAEYGVFPRGEHTELLMVLGLKNRITLPRLNATDAINVAMFALGTGFSIDNDRDREQLASGIRIQIHGRLRPSSQGVQFKAVNQTDQAAPTALSAAQVQVLTERVQSCGPVLQRYFVLAALLGQSCRGSTAFSISAKAVARRFETLGIAPPAGDLEHLCPRMPAIFPTL